MGAEVIRAQLRGLQSALQYTFGDAKNNDWLTDTLGDLLAAAGLTDVRDLERQIRTIRTRIAAPVVAPAIPQNVADADSQLPIVSPSSDVESLRGQYVLMPFEVWYDRATLADLRMARIGKNRIVNYANKPERNLVGELSYTPGRVAILDNRSGDRLQWWVYVQFIGDDIPVFVVAPHTWESGGVIKGFLRELAPFAPVFSLGISMFAPGLGNAIGSAVLGAANAAAYPALASAIGNAALGSILSGGNVRGAVVATLAGFAGSAVGSRLGAALDAPVVGRMASAATSAALVGGDPKAAAKMALLQSGADGITKG